MKVSIFGSGYVGLVQAAAFANVGHDVICMDIDSARIERMRRAEVPFFEPGLSDLLRGAIDEGLLTFTDDSEAAVEGSDYLFICVGTPSHVDGSADMRYVLGVAESIAEHADRRKVVVTKSTVPVGTAARVRRHIQQVLDRRGSDLEIEVVSNPEFLKEGSAVADCQRPDRIIIGTRSQRVEQELRELYKAFNRNHDRVIVMSEQSAELTKYAANAMLATKISFMNEMANLAEAVGADIEDIRRGIGSDPRIGYQFIYPGCGYGGSCFPKDVKALRHLASENQVPARIIGAVEDTNQAQKNRLADRLRKLFGNDLSGRTFAVWGLSFKPNTDDIREAPSRSLIESIWALGGRVRAYDPQAGEAFQGAYGQRADFELGDSKESILHGADALIVCTEWKTFWSPDFEEIRDSLARPLIIDGRNLYNPYQMKELGIEYYAIGRGLSVTGA